MVTEEERKKTPEENTDDEIALLQQKCEALYKEIRKRDTVITEMESSLKTKDGEIADLKNDAEESKKAQAKYEESLAKAVAAYREKIIEDNPGVLPEMIRGESIEEIDKSLKQAMMLVEKVKQEMEEEIARTRVPGGAPQRNRADISSLSPREKIQYAIGGS